MNPKSPHDLGQAAAKRYGIAFFSLFHVWFVAAGQPEAWFCSELMGWMPSTWAALYAVRLAPWWCLKRRGICRMFMFWRLTLPRGVSRSALRLEVGRFYSTGRYRAQSWSRC